MTESQRLKLFSPYRHLFTSLSHPNNFVVMFNSSLGPIKDEVGPNPIQLLTRNRSQLRLALRNSFDRVNRQFNQIFEERQRRLWTRLLVWSVQSKRLRYFNQVREGFAVAVKIISRTRSPEVFVERHIIEAIDAWEEFEMSLVHLQGLYR